MTTSVGLNIITGRTGTAHVASDDDAAIWRGFVGNENVVLFTDEKLALTDNGKQGDVGSLTIANGVFSIKNGHMGRVGNTATVEYALPNEGNYRRTLVIVRYAKASNIESMTLMTLQSATANDTSSASAAAALSVSTVPSTDYILYDFVCGSDGLVNDTLQTRLTVIDTIPILRAALNTETSARQSADTALGNRVSVLETFKNTETAAREAVASRVSTLEGVHHVFFTKLNTNMLSVESDDVSQNFNDNTLCLISFTSPTSAERRLHNKCLFITPEKTALHNIYGYSGPFPSNSIQYYELDRDISPSGETVYYAKIKQNYVSSGVVKITVMEITKVTVSFGTQTVETGSSGWGDTTSVNTFSRSVSTQNSGVYVNFYKVEV